jgi:hypothetical protein
MAKALCRRCKGTAEGSSFIEAAAKINHAVGLGRGLPCGANYGKTVDVSPKSSILSDSAKKTLKVKTPKSTSKVTEEKITETIKETIVTKE